MDERGDDALYVDPQEFCILLKQVDRQPPRLSRDLEPDLIGMTIKHRILDAVIAAAPEAADFERTLLERAASLDIPHGAARGVCSDIMLEWRMAHASPHFMPWMRQEAAAPHEPRKRRREEREAGIEPEWRERPERRFGIPPTSE